MEDVHDEGLEHADFRDCHCLFHHRRRLFLHHAAHNGVAQQKGVSCSGPALGHVAGPYPSLALFAVPVIVLEPAKPLSAYLIATGHFFAGAVIFITAEVLKLTVVERLFQLNKKKLLSIPAFAWCYPILAANHRFSRIDQSVAGRSPNDRQSP